jgi:hypothetical protein
MLYSVWTPRSTASRSRNFLCTFIGSMSIQTRNIVLFTFPKKSAKLETIFKIIKDAADATRLITKISSFIGLPEMATAPYFYGSILLRALKSQLIVLLTYVYKK